MTLSWEEVSDEICVHVQQWIFDGCSMDEEGFSMVDSDGNGEIDGQEAASALEYAIENHHWNQANEHIRIAVSPCTITK